jgi:hypothetical protein
MSAALAAAKRRRLTQMPGMVQEQQMQQPPVAPVQFRQQQMPQPVQQQMPQPLQPPANVQMQQPVAQTPNFPPNTPLSFQQIISIVDSRLLYLEQFVSNVQKNDDPMTDNSGPIPNLDKLKTENDSELTDKIQSIVADMLKDYIEEMDSRYEMLVTEIVHLKNTLTSLKSYTIESLQTFTLDTDKSMMDERMRIINEWSNMEENINTENITTMMEDTDDGNENMTIVDEMSGESQSRGVHFADSELIAHA